MKKIFFTILAMFFAISAFCADVIITTKSEKLEVKIVEISSTEVKYKKVSNLQGPTFVLSTNDINTIMYANGEVQVMEHKTAQPVQAAQPAQPTQYAQPAQPTQYAQPQQGYGQYPQAGGYQQPHGNNYNYNPNMPYPGTPGYAGNGIVRNGRNYYFNGQQIVLQDFLYQTCPVAYDYWRKNFVMECAGWGLLSGGVVLVVAGGAAAGVSGSGAMIGLAAVGAAAVCAGVPLGAVGHIRRTEKAVEVFNMQCAARYSEVRFNLQASQNGIGLALNF
ncbi:MAG: hypothetical protein KBT27_02265 [Prevotellaceae bacterium]|nr:hypothetical protein [Candidatus Faecinaster equi]